MVEYSYDLDSVFGSLADATRRDIIERVAHREYSVGELVAYYNVSFAAISKHLKVLEEAGLISKRKYGRKRMVSLTPNTLIAAHDYLRQYHSSWKVVDDIA